MGELGVTAGSIHLLENLARWPLTTKQDLRNHYPFGLVAAPMKEGIGVHASSGTTGKPTVFEYTHNNIRLWPDLMARSYAVAGVTGDDIIHNSYSCGSFKRML